MQWQVNFFAGAIICACYFVRELYCISDARLVQGNNVNLGEALQFLREFEMEASGMCFRVSTAQWQYSTNMTDGNKRKMIEEQMLRAKFDKLSWKKAVTFDWLRMPDNMARRQLKLLVTAGRACLPDDKYNEIHHLIAEMKDIYNNVRVCPYNNFETKFCDLILEPDVRRIMAHSRNPDELLHVWKEWHDKTGPPMKNKFMRYVQLSNQAARMNGFTDAGEQLMYRYETGTPSEGDTSTDTADFEQELTETWVRLQPLYRELFTYVRRKLLDKYGPTVVRADGPLPAHLLGNVWAQDWAELGDLARPYPHAKPMDVTDEMLRQGFTPLRMFQMAEEFYTSLGMKAMPPEFWRHSLFEKPADRKVQCTASAWDFCNKIDYRIKQCTEVTMDDFKTTHHEMAHIQYYIQYGEQPYLYRDGANPGFHEGIANAILLSVFNPTHLQRVGLLANQSDTYETNMNYIMMLALEKVAYAPYALLVDQWRRNIYKHGVQRMNAAWWQLRLRHQGVVPPLPRTEQHLDAAAKRHIAADIPYTRYYVALLLQFQVHGALCAAAGHRGAMHTCDIYRSREAGRLLTEALKLGKSRHWRDVLRIVTKGESDRLSSEAMVKFFQPLMLWLKVQNREETVTGWNANDEDTALYQPLYYNSSGSANTVFNTGKTHTKLLGLIVMIGGCLTML